MRVGTMAEGATSVRMLCHMPERAFPQCQGSGLRSQGAATLPQATPDMANSAGRLMASTTAAKQLAGRADASLGPP